MLDLQDQFSIAFLNCKRLMADADPFLLRSQIDNLSLMIETLSVDSCPDFVCLCEVGLPALGLELVKRMTDDDYQTIWSGPGRKNQTGLQVLFRKSYARATAVISDKFIRSSQARPKWLAVRFSLRRGGKPAFWLIVNHWKSSYLGERVSAFDRRRSSKEISLLLRGHPPFPYMQPISSFPANSPVFELKKEESRSLFGPTIIKAEDPIVLVGDFNCDPWDEPFRLPGNKEFWSTTFNPANVTATEKRTVFYNPMVKHPDIYQTYGSEYLWDQIIVSPTLINGGVVQLQEDSISSAGPVSEVSDHCALGAYFKC